MTTDNKTLADVQPGGMVRLGDQAERARFEAWVKNHVSSLARAADGEYASNLTHALWSAWRAALSAQPSPGGQQYAWNIAELVRVDLDRQSCPDAYMRIAMESVVKHLAARQPVGEPVAECLTGGGIGRLAAGRGMRPGTKLYTAPPAQQPAQGVGLAQLPHGIRFIEIPRRNNLDPINVFVQDYDPGRGRIVVTCYGQAWCGFWGAMGDRTVMQFVAECDAKYVASNMLSGGHGYIKKSERAYVERIATEVITEFRALTDSKVVGNG